LQRSGNSSSGDAAAVLRVGPGDRDLAGGPDASRGTWLADLHVEHALSTLEFYVTAVESDVSKIEVAPCAECAHHVVDGHIHLG